MTDKSAKPSTFDPRDLLWMDDDLYIENPKAIYDIDDLDVMTVQEGVESCLSESQREDVRIAAHWLAFFDGDDGPTSIENAVGAAMVGSWGNASRTAAILLRALKDIHNATNPLFIYHILFVQPRGVDFSPIQSLLEKIAAIQEDDGTLSEAMQILIDHSWEIDPARVERNRRPGSLYDEFNGALNAKWVRRGNAYGSAPEFSDEQWGLALQQNLRASVRAMMEALYIPDRGKGYTLPGICWEFGRNGEAIARLSDGKIAIVKKHFRLNDKTDFIKVSIEHLGDVVEVEPGFGSLQSRGVRYTQDDCLDIAYRLVALLERRTKEIEKEVLGRTLPSPCKTTSRGPSRLGTPTQPPSLSDLDERKPLYEALRDMEQMILEPKGEGQALDPKDESHAVKDKPPTAPNMGAEMANLLNTLTYAGFGIRSLQGLIGASQFVYSEKDLSLMFSFPRVRTSNGSVNKCLVEYRRGSDLFKMSLHYIHNGKSKEVWVWEDVYAEDLKRVFEDTTKLYLTKPKVVMASEGVAPQTPPAPPSSKSPPPTPTNAQRAASIYDTLVEKHAKGGVFDEAMVREVCAELRDGLVTMIAETLDQIAAKKKQRAKNEVNPRERLIKEVEILYLAAGLPSAKVVSQKLVDVLLTKAWSDLLHPSNKVSRKIYTKLTGIKLPIGLKASQQTLSDATHPSIEAMLAKLDAE